MDECDICGRRTNTLEDFYLNLCRDCCIEHTDRTLLRLLGNLLEEKRSKALMEKN